MQSKAQAAIKYCVRLLCVFFFPGELSSVACFIHKRTRIVGGGPVGILDGSWMVSIQRGYADAVNILHLLLPPLKKNSPAPASGPDQPGMDNVSAEFFLFSVFFFPR